MAEIYWPRMERQVQMDEYAARRQGIFANLAGFWGR
jgi:hypothetical protein